MSVGNTRRTNVKIHQGCTVTLEYTIKDRRSRIVESSKRSGNLKFIQGRNEVPAGLERAVEAAEPGKRLQFRVGPDEGYGRKNPNLIRTANTIAFRKFGVPRKGLMFRALVDDRERVCKVVERKGDVVKYDANHPLAGKTLEFDVRVVDVSEPENVDSLQA